jgi:hypothetical protein
MNPDLIQGETKDFFAILVSSTQTLTPEFVQIHSQNILGTHSINVYNFSTK